MTASLVFIVLLSAIHIVVCSFQCQNQSTKITCQSSNGCEWFDNECSCSTHYKTDFIFLIDSSCSISSEVFEMEKKWLIDFVNGGLTRDSRTGFDIFWAMTNNSHITLTNYSKEYVTNYISNLQHVGHGVNTIYSHEGYTNFYLALSDVIDEYTINGVDDRQKVAILITGGAGGIPYGSDDICMLMDELNELSIRVIVIGVGDQWSSDNIDCIVQYPDTDIVHISSFNTANDTEIYVDCLIQQPVIQFPTKTPIDNVIIYTSTELPSYSPTQVLTPIKDPTQPPLQTLIPTLLETNNPTPKPTYPPIFPPTYQPTSIYDKWQNAIFDLTYKLWTHLIYMAADNNRDGFAAQTLNNIAQNKSLQNINFVVFIDRWHNNITDQLRINNITDCRTNTPISPIEGNFSTAKLLQLSEGKWCQIIDFEDEMNSLAVSNIIHFTALIKYFQYSSKRFFLEFYDHGGAWIKFGEDANNGAVPVPIINTVETFIDAIYRGLQETHLQYVDVLGIDACFEADETILYYVTTKEVAKYYLASERKEPASGWHYESLDGSLDNPVNYSINIVDSYLALSDQESNAGNSYTLTLFNISKNKDFIRSFDHLITNMTFGLFNNDYGMMMAILRAASNAIVVDDVFRIDDGESLLQGLLNNNKNKFFSTCDESLILLAKDALNKMKAVILYFKTNWAKYENLTGCSLFYSRNIATINAFKKQNPNGKTMINYEQFLISMHDMLANRKFDTGIKCNATLPDTMHNSELILSETINFAYPHDTQHALIDISASVTSTVYNGDMEIYMDVNQTEVAVVKLDTIVNDIGTETYLLSHWNGLITCFVDNNDPSKLLYSTAHYFCSKNECFVIYPLQMYELDDTQNFTGYFEFRLLTPWNKTDDIIFKLFTLDNNVIREIPVVRILKIVDDFGNILVWPYVSPKIFDITDKDVKEITSIHVFALDVFGINKTSIMYLNDTEDGITDNLHSGDLSDYFSIYFWVVVGVIFLILVLVVLFCVYKREIKSKNSKKKVTVDEDNEISNNNLLNKPIVSNQEGKDETLMDMWDQVDRNSNQNNVQTNIALQIWNHDKLEFTDDPDV